jgi:hypothetical protein
LTSAAFSNSLTDGIVMFGTVNFASRWTFVPTCGFATTRQENPTVAVPPCISRTSKPYAG